MLQPVEMIPNEGCRLSSSPGQLQSYCMTLVRSFDYLKASNFFICEMKWVCSFTQQVVIKQLLNLGTMLGAGQSAMNKKSRASSHGIF